MKNEKYYLVETMCGHVGRGKFISVVFPIYAESKKEAARIARDIPRVKHHNKHAILSVKEVSYEEYQHQYEINSNDSYLNWKETRYDTEYEDDVFERVQYLENLNEHKYKEKDLRPKRSLDYWRTQTSNVYDCECEL